MTNTREIQINDKVIILDPFSEWVGEAGLVVETNKIFSIHHPGQFYIITEYNKKWIYVLD